jgi:hypothetical protein
MKKETLKKGLGILLQSFPNKEINAEIAWPILADLTDEEFERAVVNIIATRIEIYPNTNMIAMIREMAKKKTDTLLAGEAWSIVLGEVSRVGRYGAPKFGYSLIDKAVRCIGWQTICDSETIGVERAHFFKVYDSLEHREAEVIVQLPNRTHIKLISETVKKMAVAV